MTLNEGVIKISIKFILSCMKKILNRIFMILTIKLRNNVIKAKSC